MNENNSSENTHEDGSGTGLGSLASQSPHVQNNLLGITNQSNLLNTPNLLNAIPTGGNNGLNAALLNQAGISANNSNHLAAALNNNTTLRLLQQQQLQQRIVAAAALQNSNPAGMLGLMNANGALGGLNASMSSGTANTSAVPSTAQLNAIINHLNTTDPSFQAQYTQRLKMAPAVNKIKQDLAQGQPMTPDMTQMIRLAQTLTASINQRVSTVMQSLGMNHAAGGNNLQTSPPQPMVDGTSMSSATGLSAANNTGGLNANNIAQLLSLGINPANLTAEQLQILRQRQLQNALLQQQQNANQPAASSPNQQPNVPRTPGPLNAASPPLNAGSPSMTPNNPLFNSTPQIRPNTPHLPNGSPIATPGNVQMANSPSQTGNLLSMTGNMSPVINAGMMTGQNDLAARRAIAASTAGQANRAASAMQYLQYVPTLVNRCDAELAKLETDVNRRAQLTLIRTELIRSADLFKTTSQIEPFAKVIRAAFTFLKVTPQMGQQQQVLQSPPQQPGVLSASSPSNLEMNPSTPGPMSDESQYGQNPLSMTKTLSATGAKSKANLKIKPKKNVKPLGNNADPKAMMGSKPVGSSIASTNSSPRVPGNGPPKGTPGFPINPQQSTSVFLVQPLHGLAEKSGSSLDLTSGLTNQQASPLGLKSFTGLSLPSSEDSHAASMNATIPASTLLSVEKQWSSLLHKESRKRPWDFEFSFSGENSKKKRLHSLLTQMDFYEWLDPDAEDVLLDVADHFIECIVHKAILAAKHRKSKTLEPKDLQIELDRNWNIRVPGFADELRTSKKPIPNATHNSRMVALLKAKKESLSKRLHQARSEAIADLERKWREADVAADSWENDGGGDEDAFEEVEEDEVMLEGGTVGPISMST